MADAAASTPPAPSAAIAETPSSGLTSAQVAERRSRGLANAGGERSQPAVGEILRANILTRFNSILGVLGPRSPAGPAGAAAATLVTLILSLCVLVLLAVPLTWRRIMLVGALLASFVLLFPVPAMRRFYELQLPHSGLATTLAAAALGAAALGAFWVFSRGVAADHPRRSASDGQK